MPDVVTLGARDDSGPVLRIDHHGHTAEISLFGGHVLSWTPAGEAPVLWISSGARFDQSSPIRGGIPVCWPWFGGHPDNADWPSHGVARVSHWDLEDLHVDDNGVVVTMVLPDGADLKPYWPFSSRPKLSVEVGATLALTLGISNVDDQPLSIGQALHTYFSVGDIAEVSIQGLERAPYIDKLAASERAHCTADGAPIHISREVDRIYRDIPDHIQIADRSLGRTILIEHTGATNAVVWNPWTEKTKRLPDMGPESAYRGMVCVETGNVPPDQLLLAPGETHALTTRISVLRAPA